MTELSRIQKGDTACCEFTIGEDEVQVFSDLTQDTNPLHMDETFARQRGFERRVAHGMLALSAISRLIGTQLPGPGSLWIAQDVQFAAPVFVGDRIKASIKVRSVSQAAQVVVLETEAITTHSQVVVLRGTAKVRVPQVKDMANES
jgi:3-hydroxybutyryl-CoA dehydratase